MEKTMFMRSMSMDTGPSGDGDITLVSNKDGSLLRLYKRGATKLTAQQARDLAQGLLEWADGIVTKSLDEVVEEWDYDDEEVAPDEEGDGIDDEEVD